MSQSYSATPECWVSTFIAYQYAGFLSESDDIHGGATEHAHAHGVQVPAHLHPDDEPQTLPSARVEVRQDTWCAKTNACGRQSNRGVEVRSTCGGLGFCESVRLLPLVERSKAYTVDTKLRWLPSMWPPPHALPSVGVLHGLEVLSEHNQCMTGVHTHCCIA